MTEKKQESFRERLRRARRKRRLPPREGHEISAAGKEMRTPTHDEFIGNLEKASQQPHAQAGGDGRE